MRNTASGRLSPRNTAVVHGRCRRIREWARGGALRCMGNCGSGRITHLGRPRRYPAVTIRDRLPPVVPRVSDPTTFTQQFHAARAGDQSSLDALLPLVYDELKRIARAQLRRERPGHTLQATALVHEAYLRLLGVDAVEGPHRAWFMGMAATMMRRILVNHARDRRAEKRGAGAVHASLAEAEQIAIEDVDLIGLHDALEALALLDERQARIVELKYFAGMEIDEMALTLGVSPATVRRDWAVAKLWLARELKQ